MGSLFILIWTENAPPLSVQIKIKRDLTLGNVSFYLNLDRHQYLAQSRVYQCAKTSKSRILNLILVKYNILTIKAMFFIIFCYILKPFCQNFDKKSPQKPISWKWGLVEQIWGQIWPPIVNPTTLNVNISSWLKFSLETALKFFWQIMISKLWSADYDQQIMISKSWSANYYQ